MKMLKTLRHVNIIKLWCVCTNSEPNLLVTDYMKHGSLVEYFREGTGKSVDLRDVIDMSKQILNGMIYLEASKCVHRNLTAKNILVGDMNSVKVANLSLAKFQDKESIEGKLEKTRP